MAHTKIIISSMPGLIPQMVGFLASNKFHYTSFFVNNKSNFTFIYHQESTLADNTIFAKRAYEVELRKYSKEA